MDDGGASISNAAHTTCLRPAAPLQPQTQPPPKPGNRNQGRFMETIQYICTTVTPSLSARESVIGLRSVQVAFVPRFDGPLVR